MNIDNSLKRALAIFSIVSLIVVFVAFYLTYTYVSTVNPVSLTLIMLGLVYFGWGYFSSDGRVFLWMFSLPTFVGGGYFLCPTDFWLPWYYFPIVFFIVWILIVVWGIKNVKGNDIVENSPVDSPVAVNENVETVSASIDFPAGNGQRGMVSIADTMAQMNHSRELLAQSAALQAINASTERRKLKKSEREELPTLVAQGYITADEARVLARGGIDPLVDLTSNEETFSSGRQPGRGNNWSGIVDL